MNHSRAPRPDYVSAFPEKAAEVSVESSGEQAEIGLTLREQGGGGLVVSVASERPLIPPDGNDGTRSCPREWRPRRTSLQLV